MDDNYDRQMILQMAVIRAATKSTKRPARVQQRPTQYHAVTGQSVIPDASPSFYSLPLSQ